MAASKQQQAAAAERERLLREGVADVADRASLDLDATPLDDTWLFALAPKPLAADVLERALAGAGWHTVRLTRRDGGKPSKASTVSAYWLASRSIDAPALGKLARQSDALDAAFAAGDVSGVDVRASDNFDYADYLLYEVEEEGRDEAIATMRAHLPPAVVEFVLGARTRYAFYGIEDSEFAHALLRVLGAAVGGVLMSNDDTRFRSVAIV